MSAATANTVPISSVEGTDQGSNPDRQGVLLRGRRLVPLADRRSPNRTML
jgi:hypothetical protein